jgi:hypothetical protein
MEYRLRKNDLSLERLDGEIIAIDFISGKYLSFIGPSADLLWLVQSSVPRAKWWGLVGESFVRVPSQAGVDAEIDAFLSSMVELGIIESSDEVVGVVESLPNDYVRGGWTQPVYAIEDDLVDLLIIDPIHDASDDGWPQTSSE